MKKNHYYYYGLFKLIPIGNKFLLKMKISAFLFFCCTLNIFANPTYSQATRISLNLKDATIDQTLNKIEDVSEFYFLFNTKLINVTKKINIEADNELLKDILYKIFDDDVKFFVYDKQIILLPTTETPPSVAMQQLRITGMVTGTDGTPLPGVNVLITGTTTGTITDNVGHYSIDVPEGSKSLTFSFIGMEPQEINIGASSQIDVTLIEKQTMLEEVVLVGYGTQAKKAVTSSVSSIEMPEIANLPTTSISQALAGRAAGLTVKLNSAQPLGAADIQIRGAATGRSPLIVIDGMPTSDFSMASVSSYANGSMDATLSTLDQNDIESIDILKDASATSIYGSKAAGGVILITTKRGKTTGDTEKVAVDFSSSVGIEKLYNLPEMLTPKEYMIEVNRALLEDNLYGNRTGIYSTVPKAGNWTPPPPYIPTYTDEQINGEPKGADWVKEVTRPGIIQNYNLSVRGGSKDTRYYISFSNANDKGVIKNNSVNKYTGRLNLDQNFGEKLTGGITTSFSQINSNNVELGNGGLYSETGIFNAALQYDPTLPVYNEDGGYQINTRHTVVQNPVAFFEDQNISRLERLFTTANLEYTLFDGLSFKGQVGFDRNQSEGYFYTPRTTLKGAAANGIANRQENVSTNYQFQFLTNFRHSFGKHDIAATLGTEYMKYNREGLNVQGSNFPYDGALWNNLVLGSFRPTIGSSGGRSELASYFLRTTYDFNSKIFLNVNLRLDGSSNFSPTEQYALFPGVSLGWDISKESFMGFSHRWLNQLKLRAGYGITGNDNIGTAFTDWYAAGSNIMWGNSLISGIGLAGLGNPSLTWEKQVDINAGIDFSLFNDRIYGSLDVYNRVISRILGSKPLGSWNPVSTISYNQESEKQSYGAELTLNTRNVVATDFSWNSGLTFTFYRDRWLKRDPSYVLGINESEKQYFNELWYAKSDGLWPAGSTETLNGLPVIPGTIKILDVDGYLLDEAGARVVDEHGRPQYSGEPDGKIDDADQVKLGVNIPFNIGFNNTFNYKRFDLSIYTYGVFNQWKSNATLTTFGGPQIHYIVEFGYNEVKDILNRWNSDNQTGTGASSLQMISQTGGAGDYYLEKAWFVRVRSIALGYNVPFKIKGSNKRLRVYGTVMNPFLFTPYTGMDPETDGYVGAYPPSHTYSLGVNFSL